jgi:dihydrofolate synthase/folylpolyglutamate synthase
VLPGRFELVRREPPVVIDGAHNPQAAEVLARAIEDAWLSRTARPLIVLGVLADKDVRGMVAALAPVASGFAVVTPESPRAMEAESLAGVVQAVTGTAPAVLGTVRTAAREVVGSACATDGVVFTGSLSTAGQARSALRDTSATA